MKGSVLWQDKDFFTATVTSPQSRRSLYELRYQVYVNDRQLNFAHADHSGETLQEPIDDFSELIGIYDYRGNTFGTIRTTISTDCPNNEIPYLQDYFQYEKLHRNQPYGLASKLAIVKNKRGTGLALDICKSCIQLLLEHNVQILFIDVGYGAISFMRRLGFRPYLGVRDHPDFGPSLPMYLKLTKELDHLKAVRSPFLSMASHYTKLRSEHMKTRIHNEFLKVLKKTHASPGFQRILTKEMSVAHYASFVRQIFHYSRHNPKIQVLATVYFNDDEHDITRRYFQHAASEIGHDIMALNDLKAMGYDTEMIPFEKPLPETTALVAYAFYQIQHVNQLGHLGYMYFLENLATTDSQKIVTAFREVGVTDDALSFIDEHITVDVHHTKLLDLYIDTLVKTKSDADEVIYGIETTAVLYDLMISAAFRAVDESYDYTRFMANAETQMATA